MVQIVSQLQVVAEDKGYGKGYDVTYEKYAKHTKLIRIFACRNATLVGLLGILLQLKRTSDEYKDMKWARVHAIESGDQRLTSTVAGRLLYSLLGNKDY